MRILILALVLSLLPAPSKVEGPAPQEPPPQSSLVKHSPQTFEFLPPAGYDRMPVGALPDDVHRFFQYRYERRAGSAEWEVIRLVVDASRRSEGPDPLLDPLVLQYLVFTRDAEKAVVSNLVPSTRQEKREGIPMRTTEVQFTRDSTPFVALGAVFATEPKAIFVAVGAPSSPGLVETMRADFARAMTALKIPSKFLPAGEIARISSQCRILGVVALALGALYPLCWVLFFRGSAGGLHWLRVAWLAAVTILWGAGAWIGTDALPTLRGTEQTIPFFVRLEVVGPLAVLFLLLTIVKVVRPRSAWAWA